MSNLSKERFQWQLGALLIGIVFVAYWPALHGGFIWDDDKMLTENIFVKARNGLHSIWFSTALPDYFPLTSTSFWVEWRCWGLNSLGYHMTNVVLHGLNSVLLWRVLRKIEVPAAWLGAALFALHPVNVESVAWITERKNTLSFFFMISALLFFLGSEESPPGRQCRDYAFSLILFFLALLSKTSVVMLPIVLLLLAVWRNGKLEKRDWLRSLPFFALSLIFGLVTIWFQYHRAIGSDDIHNRTLVERVAAAGWAVWFYLIKAAWPFGLTFVYPTPVWNAQSPATWLPLILLAAAFVTLFYFRKTRARAVLFALTIFVVMLLPVVGLLKIYFHRYSLVADHWQYFSLPAFTGLLASAVFRWLPQKKILWTSAGSLMVFYFSLSWLQCSIYQNEKVLWFDTVTSNPTAWIAHNNLGRILKQENRMADAETYYRNALLLRPDLQDAHYNLGNLLLETGRIKEAIAHYEFALNFKPNDAEFHNNFGIALFSENRVTEAIEHFRKALRLSPNFLNAYYNLGIALESEKKIDEAVEQYRYILRMQPDSAPARKRLKALGIFQ